MQSAQPLPGGGHHDLDDIQGVVFYGYGGLRAAQYVLLEIGDPSAARTWLASLSGDITSSVARPTHVALNVAFTRPGLGKIGLHPNAVAMFSPQWAEGIVEPHRSRILGDVGESAPEHWDWGGPNTAGVDVLLMLFAADEVALSEAYLASTDKAGANGMREIRRLNTVDLGDKEHFGFHDGISQPVLAGSSKSGLAMNTIQPGEFLLGYPNEHGQLTPRPLLDPGEDPDGLLPNDPAGSGRPDLGRNGSYLVFRQLAQDVHGFWQYADRATRGADGTSYADERTLLAAKLVGRWPSGAPLVKAPERDDPELAQSNDFAYYVSDPYGFRCPVGAHVRRANPRDSLEPGPGTDKSIQVGKRHRIIRRGREYGRPVDPETLLEGLQPDSNDSSDARGLHFICICGNIARQFEFIQHTWIMSPKFDGLYEDDDPLLGGRGGHGATFTVQAIPVRRRFQGLPRFVTVRGGAYFFLPGLRALRYLASLDGKETSRRA